MAAGMRKTSPTTIIGAKGLLGVAESFSDLPLGSRRAEVHVPSRDVLRSDGALGPGLYLNSPRESPQAAVSG